jgi:hypothetical protein
MPPPPVPPRSPAAPPPARAERPADELDKCERDEVLDAGRRAAAAWEAQGDFPGAVRKAARAMVAKWRELLSRREGDAR